MASEIEDTRSLAQFWFEIGFGSCWAEALVKNGYTSPFELTDEVMEQAWSIAPVCADDYEEFDRRLGQANSVERLTAENAALRGALAWYGEQARLARLIHSEGDAGRHALSDDGGKRATAALSEMAREARS